MKQLYFHADVVTMEEENGEIQTAQAVLVEDGTIIEIGDEEELRRKAGENCEYIDCEGKALLPAFIDAHSHLTAQAQSFSYCDLSGAKSFADITNLLVDFAVSRGIKQGEYVIGFGYDHNALLEKRHPDRHVLDRASQEIIKKLPESFTNFPGNDSENEGIPIAISHASGHMGVLSTAALHAMGIAASPENKMIGREADGSLSGYLEEKAFIDLTAAMPKPSPEQSMKNIERAQQLYWSYGITTMQDGLTKADEWKLLKAMAEQEKLHSDVVCYVDLKDHRAIVQENPEYTKNYRNHLRIGGYKIFLDGSPQGKTAWLTEPYEGETDYRGYPSYSDEQVQAFVRESVEDSQQLLAHCNGDAAAQQYIDACEQIGGTAKLRPVMIHAQLLREDQLPKLKELGMIPSYFVAHTWFWGDIHLKNLGKARAEKISPVKTAVELGLPYTFHQDTPVIPPDMMQTVWCAVNRRSKDGVVLGEQQRVSVKDALKAVTVNAAYQYFEENQKGSICRGKQADFVLLSENPLKADPKKLNEIRVLKTFFRGEKVYEAQK